MLFFSLLIILIGVFGEDAVNYPLLLIGQMKMYYIDIVICASFIIIILKWRTLLFFENKSILMPLTIFLGWMFICIFKGMGRFSYSAIGEARIVLPLVFFFVSYSLILESRSPAVLNALGKMLAVSALGVLVVFLVELYVGHRASLSLMANPDLDFGYLEDARGVRILGTLQTFTAGVFFIFILLNILHRNQIPFTYKLLGLAMPVIMLVSMNRAAIISQVFGLTIYTLFFTKTINKVKVVVISSLSLIVIILSLYLLFPERYQELRILVISVTNPEIEPTHSWAWRKAAESMAFQVFRDNPITGQGFGGYWGVFSFFGQPVQSLPHNQYLILLAKTGIIGLVLFILLIIGVIKDYLKYYRVIPHYARALFDTMFIIIISSIPYGFAYSYVDPYGFYLGIFAGILHRSMPVHRNSLVPPGQNI